MRKDLDLDDLRKNLEEELTLLKKELNTVGEINPNNPKDWIAKPAQMDTLSADQNEVADSYEAYEENAGVLKDLEIRFNEVTSAIERMGDGSYGFCAECKKPIEKERLQANPAAKTCMLHMA